VYLYALTNDNEYKKFIDDDYAYNLPSSIGITAWLAPEADALLYYTKTQ
jgi:hypothetical protein